MNSHLEDDLLNNDPTLVFDILESAEDKAGGESMPEDDDIDPEAERPGGESMPEDDDIDPEAEKPGGNIPD